MRRITRWLLNALTMLPLLLCVMAVMTADAGEHWNYFAIYGRRPVLVDGAVEFGWLGTARPYVPTAAPQFSASGPYSYHRDWPQPPAVSTQRQVLWHWGDSWIERGNLVPPWGWRLPPTYNVDNGFRSIFGRQPQLVIPYHAVRIPLIYLAILSATVPAWRVLAALRRSRIKRAGRCVTCAYDLTGNVSGVCPECGTKIEKSTA